MIKRILSLIMIFQMAFPLSLWARDKEEYDSKKCGHFKIISDVDNNNTMTACRLDSGVLDRDNKTKNSETNVYAPAAIVEAAKNSSRIIDEVLLAEVKKMAQEKMKPLEAIYNLPDNKETIDLKEAVTEFKKMILESDKSAIHQIRIILSVYPQMEDELRKNHKDYDALLCKYEVWKHNREILAKFAKITGKVMTALLLVASVGTAIPAFMGVFSITVLGPILLGLGIAESATGGFKMFATLKNWDDVPAGRIGKLRLRFNGELVSYIDDLQKEPVKNEHEILELQKLLLSSQEKKEMKDLRKQKNSRIKALVSSSLEIMLGAASVAGGSFLKARFNNFNPKGAAQTTGGGVNPLPGSGGNDPGAGGFPTDDGG